MIISHQHRFIFLKTTKTAGTSIEIALSQHCGPDDVITPISAEDEAIRKELGFRGPQNCCVPPSKLDLRGWFELLKLGRLPEFVKHMPASRVRAYAGGEVWNDYFVFCFERNPYDKAISRYYWSTRSGERPAIGEFLRTVGRKQLSNWHIYTIGNEIAVKFLGRYEQLREDLQTIWKSLKLPGEPALPKAKGGYRTDRRHYSEVLDDASRSLIEQVCGREIRALGYEFESPDAAEQRACA
jgi:hypothetical protein